MDSHRIHMRYEIERQNREWKRLNRRESDLRAMFWVLGIVAVVAVGLLFSGCSTIEIPLHHTDSGRMAAQIYRGENK